MKPMKPTFENPEEVDQEHKGHRHNYSSGYITYHSFKQFVKI
jgi:hypothetical protein